MQRVVQVFVRFYHSSVGGIYHEALCAYLPGSNFSTLPRAIPRYLRLGRHTLHHPSRGSLFLAFWQ